MTRDVQHTYDSILTIGRESWKFAISGNRNLHLINQQRAEAGLRHAFKSLSYVIPADQPSSWYLEVFMKFDEDKDGCIDMEDFLEIILQMYEHYSETLLQPPSVCEPVTPSRGINSRTGLRSTCLKKPINSHTIHESRRHSSPECYNLCVQSRIMFPHYDSNKFSIDYIFECDVGRGAFGSVRVVRHKTSGVRRACKEIPIINEFVYGLIEQEIGHLKSLRHPNILNLIEIYRDHRCIYLVTELCEGGPLLQRIIDQYEKKREPLTEIQVTEFMEQILSATRFCHEHNVIHRDIKPENILFVDTHNSHLKVIDFGLAATNEHIATRRIETEEQRTGVIGALARMIPTFGGKQIITHTVKKLKMESAGTPHYMAPEMLKGKYDSKCDIFSIGVILYQLLTGIHPFYVASDTEHSVTKKILQTKISTTGDAWRYVSEAAKDLVRRMLSKDPQKRPSAVEALQHEWFIQTSAKKSGSYNALTNSVFEGLKNWQNVNAVKQAILKVMARQLTEAEIKDIRHKFEALDMSQTGTITLDELKINMQDKQHNVSEEDLKQIFNSLDTNGNERIYYNDFIAALLAKRKDFQEVQLRDMFNRLDLHSKNKLDMDTLRKAVKQRFGSLTDEQMQSIFSQIDRNGDGYVDFQEFCYLMTS